MNKDEFAKKLKTRIVFFRVYFLLFFLISASIRIVDACYNDFFNESNRFYSFLSGFITGASIAQLLFVAVMHIKFCKALNDKELFEKLYIIETDERYAFIRQKCGAEVILPMSLVMISVGLILGFFNFTVCITLVFAAIFQMLVCLFVKIYYWRKY